MIACLFQVAHGSEGFLEVLTPPAQVSVKTAYLHVVGRTSATQVRIDLNGTEVSVVKVKDSIFHYHLMYGYGLNEVRVTALALDSPETGGESVTLEIMYSPNVSRKFQRLYPKYVFHDAEARSDCVRCHDCDCEDLSEVSDAATCLDCHHDFKEHFEKHTEADDQLCITCHQLDRNLSLSMTSGGIQNPCFRCHKDKIGQFAQKYIHGPVAGGSCTICHDPHGSRYENNLKLPEPVLCITCHEAIEDEMQLDVVHRPFADGKCTACHDAHSTNNESVLIKCSEEVCLECHLEQGTLQKHQHPYNVAPSKALEDKLRLTEDGTLECLSCHEPHSTNSPHLLKLSS